MAITLSPNEAVVTKIEGQTIFAFSIDTEFEIDSDVAAMPGDGNGKAIGIQDSNSNQIYDETFICDPCYNVGVVWDLQNKELEYDDTSWSDDIIAITGSATGFTPTPAGWAEAVRQVPESEYPYKFKADMLIRASYTHEDDVSRGFDVGDGCRGQSLNYSVRIWNRGDTNHGLDDFGATAIKDLNLEITDEIRGSTENISFGDIKFHREEEPKLQYDIPEDIDPERFIDNLSFNATSSNTGQMSDNLRLNVGSDPRDLFLKGIGDVSVCPGSSLSPNVVAENASNCPAEMFVRISNDHNDEVVTTDVTEVSTGDATPGTHSYRVDLNIPDVDRSVDSITYTASLRYKDYNPPQDIDEETFTVDINHPSLAIGPINSPNRACSGDNVRLSVDVDNDSACDGGGRILLSNDVNDNVLKSDFSSVRADSSRSYRLESTIPEGAGTEIVYTATLVDGQGNQLDEKQFEINVGSVSLSLSNLSFPDSFDDTDSVCAGRTVDWSVDVANQGECQSRATVAITPETEGEREVVETTNIRADSDTSIRSEWTIPVSKQTRDSEKYTVEVFSASADGSVLADSSTAEVTIESSDVNVVGTTSPSAKCVGSDITGVVTVENSGKCEVEYRVLVTDDISGNERQVERTTLRSNTRERVVFDDVMPESGVENDGITYEYSVETLKGGQFDEVASGTMDVGVRTSDITVDGLELPDTSCVGTDVNGKVILSNNSKCSAEFRAILDKPLTAENEVIVNESIAANTQDSVNFTDLVPLDAVNKDAINHGVTIEKRDFDGQSFQKDDSIEGAVKILTSKLDVSSVISPEQNCIGTNFQISTKVENTGQCKSQYRILYERPIIGEDGVIGKGTIGSGNEIENSIEQSMDSRLADESESVVNIILQKRVNSDFDWQSVDNKTISISVLKPDVKLIDDTYEDTARPGDKRYEVILENQGECDTSVTVDIAGETVQKQISSGSTANIIDEFKLLGEPVERSITVQDDILNQQLIDTSFAVKPIKFLNVDQSSGTIDIKGGFSDDIIYKGTITATGIRETANLEEEDTVVGGLGFVSVQGTATSDPNDLDTVVFGSLKGISMTFEKSVTVILDGEVKGVTKSYRHTTVTTSVVDPSDMDKANIETFSGPMSNAGALRRRAGLEPRLLSSPFINRWQ